MAVLQSEDAEPSAANRHALDEKLNLIPLDNQLRAVLAEVVQLSAFATSYRYVKPGGQPAKAPSDDALDDLYETVNQAREIAAREFEVDLNAGLDVPAQRPSPIRALRNEAGSKRTH